MYHLAGKFQEKDHAGETYRALESAFRAYNFRAHLTRLQLRDGFTYVSVIHPDESMVTPAVSEVITRELSRGEICQLPEEVLQTIIQRVKDRREQRTGSSEFESHTPTRVDYRVPVLRESETGEIVQTFPGQVEITGEMPFRTRERWETSSPMQTGIPFIIRYRNAQEHLIADKSPTEQVKVAMSALIDRKLRRSEKYQFDASALAMLRTVHDPNAQNWLALSNHVWIEFQHELATPYGANIRALWVHSMETDDALREMFPAGQNPQLHRLMMRRNALYQHFWSFNVITSHSEEMFDFTYDVAHEDYVYLYSHVCPYGNCSYPVPETLQTLGECQPCSQCQTALAYWASILHTSLRIIRREYALAPQEPPPWTITPEVYTEQAQVKVGKGKNARVLKQAKTREIAYRLVKFEVSELSEQIRAQEEQASQEKGKRANWLKLAQAGAPESIIWEYRTIDTSKGRTLDPARNPRWKVYQHVEITPFKRWVPLLAGERKTMRRVHAKRYVPEEEK